jgi:hypothetical protein
MKMFNFASLFLPLFFAYNIECNIGEVTFSLESSWKNSFGSCGFPLPPNHFATAGLTNKYMKLPPGISNPNDHPLCVNATCLLIKGPLGSVVMQVDDTIGGNNDNVNIADAAFSHLANLNLGRVKMEWNFVDCKTNPLGPLKK